MVKNASWEVQLMSLAEDVGLIKMVNGPAGVECVYGNAMLLPDWATNAIVVFTIVFWLVQSKII